MSKLKVKKKLNKPAESLPKDSEKLQNNPSAPSLSPAENISASTSTDFQNAIQESKANIANAEAEAKGKRGRKALPRDANGNIIRPEATASLGGMAAPLVVNQAEVEKLKPVVGMAIDACSGLVEKRYGDADARATQDERLALVECGAFIVEKYMPNAMGAYGAEIGFAFAAFTWGFRCWKIGINQQIALEKASQEKTKLQDNKIPAEKK